MTATVVPGGGRAMQGDQFAKSWEEGYELGRLSAQGVQSAAAPRWVAPAVGPPQDETFGEMLTRLILRRKLTFRAFSREVGIDPSFVFRMRTGVRDQHPKRPTVDAMARGLNLNDFEYRCFVVAAGYAPVARWTAELEAAVRAGDP